MGDRSAKIGFMFGVACFAYGCQGQLAPSDLSDGQAPNADGAIDGSSSSDSGIPSENTASPLQRAHRLNRLEYDLTIQHLLGIKSQPSSSLTPDPSMNGFDNNAEALTVSATQVDAYFRISQGIVREALASRPYFQFDFFAEDLAPDDAEGNIIAGRWAMRGDDVTLAFDVPAAHTRYEVTVHLGALQSGTAPAPQLEVLLDGESLDTFAVPGTVSDLSQRTYNLQSEPGAHTLSLRPTNHHYDPTPGNVNDVVLELVSIQSADHRPGPGASLVMVCDPGSAFQDGACTRRILTTFAGRAWRRPLSTEETTALDSLLSELRALEITHDEALHWTLASVIASPKFLFRLRTTADKDDPQWLDSFVLASRLSYFLWSSMPDAELREVALTGELSSIQGLASQTRRMLADAKSAALTRGFAEQWLAVRDLANTNSVSATVRKALENEARTFFDEQLRAHSPVASQLRASFDVQSSTLMEHYGNSGARPGMLGLGAWLTATSDGEHTSPIRRGRWLAERALCDPVPAPPAGLEIGELMQGADETIRQSLERHRSDPACASCHARLDVLGIGFELYDAAGRLRSDDVDSVGEFPVGNAFVGPEELAARIEDNQAVGCLLEQLGTYALGRALLPEERARFATYAHELADANFEEVVVALVLDPAFRAPAPFEGTAEASP